MSEHDPPPDESVEEERNERFASVRRGYYPAQVDAFLVAIASRIRALEAELHELRVAPSSPAKDAPEGSAKRISMLGEVAEREVQEMIEEARAEAATIVSEAGIEADRITTDAQRAATRAVDEASEHLSQVEEEARRIPSDAAERRRQMVEETKVMQERLLRIAKELDLVVKDGA